MTRAEAKREVLICTAALLDYDDDQGWLYTGVDGRELSDPDKRRMLAARDDLCRELRRRAGR